MFSDSHIISPLAAITVVSNTVLQSLRFYTEGLGYRLLAEGVLTDRQKASFGKQLNRYFLLGYTVQRDPLEGEGGANTQGTASIVRLVETTDKMAEPNRVGANPWDNGLCVFEAGTPDVERAYTKLLRARFGAICPPYEFDCEAPEPLGYILMRSTAFIGPAGEQVFVTQIVNRRGGISLLKEKAVDGINVPANAVISLKSRAQQDFYRRVLGLYPVNDVPMQQPLAAAIMAGPADMGFDMCLMGAGSERIGMEQHVYDRFHPDYAYRTFPCSFQKTGLVAATWYGRDFDSLEKKLASENKRILSRVGLPILGNSEPNALVFEGIVGEIIELLRF
jgi:catechol 2,3-dioxygenase-like lactoylglutathione lyase family enzyme